MEQVKYTENIKLAMYQDMNKIFTNCGGYVIVSSNQEQEN